MLAIPVYWVSEFVCTCTCMYSDVLVLYVIFVELFTISLNTFSVSGVFTCIV